jgi:hypothetical protein
MTETALTLDTMIAATNEPAVAPKPAPLDSLSEPKAPRDPSGKFAKKETEDDVLRRLMVKHGEPAPEAAAAKPEEEHSEGKPAESTADPKAKGTPALNRARKALEYDGWEASDLDDLPEERLVALGEKASKRQADVANKLRAASAKAKQDGEAKAAGVTEPGSAEPAQPPDLKATFKPFLDELALDEKASGAFVDALSKAIDPLQSELRATREQLQAMQVERFSGEVQSARTELSERFPQLSDDGDFAEVLADAQALAAGLRERGLASTVAEAFERVARMRFGETEPKSSPSKSPELDRKRDLGQPKSGTKQIQAKGLTPEQRERAAYEWLEKHPGDRAGAARITRGE